MNYEDLVELKLFWRLRRLEVWFSEFKLKECIMILFSISYNNPFNQKHKLNNLFLICFGHRPFSPFSSFSPSIHTHTSIPSFKFTNLFCVALPFCLSYLQRTRICSSFFSVAVLHFPARRLDSSCGLRRLIGRL